jgi:hypothetical protein
MRLVPVLILILTGMVMPNTPAFAHRPYYSQVEKIRLADGEIGELRLIHGDGIVFTDPVRPLIINSQGYLVAKGPIARSIVISCSGDHRCMIVDLWGARVYEPEPGSFRQGPAQPAVRSTDRTDDWDLVGGDEAWGFTMRAASIQERATANLVLARQSLSGLVAIAVFAGLGAFALVPFRLNITSRRRRIAARIALSFTGSMVFLLLVTITFWFSMLSGLSFGLWLIPTITGAGAVWIAAGIVKRRSRRAGAA